MGYLVTDENNIAIVYLYVSWLRRAINAITVRASDMTVFLRRDRIPRSQRVQCTLTHIPFILLSYFPLYLLHQNLPFSVMKWLKQSVCPAKTEAFIASLGIGLTKLSRFMSRTPR